LLTGLVSSYGFLRNRNSLIATCSLFC
jgi:hypothetical protein